MCALKDLADIRQNASSLACVANEIALSEGAFNAKQGLSLLQVRSAVLMRYTRNLARHALGRVRGRSDARLISALVHDYIILGKLRPMAKSLNHHVELLLNEMTSHAAHPTLGSEKSHRPNPKAMSTNRTELISHSRTEPSTSVNQEAPSKGGVMQYQPPRLTQALDIHPDDLISPQNEPRTMRRVPSSHIHEISQAVAEVKGYPQHLRDGPLSNHDSMETDRKFILRRKYEESNLTRLPESAYEKKRRRAVFSSPGVEGTPGSQFAELLTTVEKTSKIVKRGISARGRKGRR